LAQKRARNQALEQQLAAHRNDQKLLPAPARDKLPTAPLPASDKPVMPADHKALTLTARPTAPEAERLMVQARLLLDQGKIIAARSVLERATESGSTLALFLLAETYDTAILSAWEIFGRHGDVKKAQELYTNAVAGGVHEAKHRLSALR
jgi:hypothetical protein